MSTLQQLLAHLNGFGECPDLRGANLDGAHLYGANLGGANLYGANLYGANLGGANLPPFQITPEVGNFIAWKSVRSVIVQLRITGKRTSSLVGRKCRCSKATVVKVFNDSGEITSNRGVTYKNKAVVIPDKYDDDPRVECTNGIHFFMTRKEAEESGF